jgi:hypothetical protein
LTYWLSAAEGLAATLTGEMSEAAPVVPEVCFSNLQSPLPHLLRSALAEAQLDDNTAVTAHSELSLWGEVDGVRTLLKPTQQAMVEVALAMSPAEVEVVETTTTPSTTRGRLAEALEQREQ